MTELSFVQSNFLGGEWSPLAQGRIDLPNYRTAMNVCLNGIPIEAGAWVRRPATQHALPTRNGNPGRVIAFDFQGLPSGNTLELTDSAIRWRSGPSLANTNDSQAIASISNGTPAVIQTSTAHGWTTGQQAYFSGLGNTCGLLHNDIFTMTVVDTTHVSLVDGVTGIPVDGSLLTDFVPATGGTISRVAEILTSPYSSGQWANVRFVQGDKFGVFLHGSIIPQFLTVQTAPNLISGAFATFALGNAVFRDGPYLDPVPGGALLTPSALTGNVQLTISFNTYDATRSYSKGDFVTSSTLNYQSLIDNNLANTPASSPSAWKTVSPGIAVGPNGFQGSDVGRLVRIFSEPPVWNASTAYTIGQLVSFSSTNNNIFQSGNAYAYYQQLKNVNTGTTPGTDATTWALVTGSNVTVWTWGKILSLLNFISAATGTAIGDMTQGSGLSAAFDGTLQKIQTACADKSATFSFFPIPQVNPVSTLSSYVGKNYTGGAQQIGSAEVFPSTDFGFADFNVTFANGAGTRGSSSNLTLNLRAKQTAPASSSDGTLLGSQTIAGSTLTPVTITSNDLSTSWNFVWIEYVATTIISNPVPVTGIGMENSASQVQFFNPTGSGSGTAGVNLQILGAPLLYTTPARIWRLGTYSNTTGWPTCGTWHEGRLWLAGAIGNRIDASVVNGVNPSTNTIDFTPTGLDGTVSSANGISYVFNAPDVSQILWMTPDLQGIIAGTLNGEWLVQATTLNSPLSPLNMQAHRVTRIGCANIEPRRCEHTLVFVQKFQRKVMEYFPDVFSGKFTAPNLNDKSKHLTLAGIQELAYQQELAPIIWARCGDGSLIGCTYKRETLMTSQGPTFYGWHRHALGSGRIVESITVGASPSGVLSSLTMVTNDPTTNFRHVEVLSDLPDESLTLTGSRFLDDFVIPAWRVDTNSNSVIFTGLNLFEGKTVTGMAGGLDLGDFTVTGGRVTLPLGGDVAGLFTQTFINTFPGTLPVYFGFTYNSDGQIIRPATAQETGSRNGPGFGKTRRSAWYSALLFSTQGFYVGTQFTALNLAKLTTDGGTLLSAQTLKTGFMRDTLTDAFSFDSAICWRIKRPFPATVVAISQIVEAQER